MVRGPPPFTRSRAVLWSRNEEDTNDDDSSSSDPSVLLQGDERAIAEIGELGPSTRGSFYVSGVRILRSDPHACLTVRFGSLTSRGHALEFEPELELTRAMLDLVRRVRVTDEEAGLSQHSETAYTPGNALKSPPRPTSTSW